MSTSCSSNLLICTADGAGRAKRFCNLRKRVADCPPYRFKCLRGELQTKEIHDLLKALTTKEITLKEMEIKARHIKERGM